jgi:hypothetical protein
LVSCVSEVVGAFCGIDFLDDFSGAFPQSVDGALVLFADFAFDLGKGLLDRIQIG